MIESGTLFRRNAKLNGFVFVLVVVLITSFRCSAQTRARPLYTIDLMPLLMGGTSGSSSVAFLSDHVLVFGSCFKNACSIETDDLSGAEPHALSGIRIVDRYRQIKRARDGGVLLTGIVKKGVRGCLHFDLNLTTPKTTPGTTGDLENCEELPPGTGRIVARSDSAVAFLQHGVIRIENMQGKNLGTFTVSIPDNEVPTAHLLGTDRILIQRSGQPEIRDFSGRVLSKFKKPDSGYGRYVAASSDGTRLLYDVLTRHVGFTQTMKEDLLLLPSMGMEADGFAPNGELVRVIDAGSGNNCFEWRTSGGLPIQLYEHSAIDPSGHFVAIIANRFMSIFKLPDRCDRR